MSGLPLGERADKGDRPMDRRLAAILAADVAGYSALTGVDEEGTLRALKGHMSALEPIIGINGGRMVKTMGDGFLAEFASVVDAVACAETMQRHMAERNAARGASPELRFRMGVHVSDMVVDGDDILGEGVNIAARLESIAEPGGVVVSGRVREDVAGKLDFGFRDLGPQSLKNIARPVPAFAIEFAEVSGAVAAAPERPEKPSVAVLAFDNLSSDPEQDYFADGITEDVITALSRVPWIFVIARNSSFSYKGLSVDIRRVGRELGVRYVLEGSVRKAGNRLRVTGQLIDAETGAHIWAERYDGVLEDVFELQDRITQAVVGAIAPAIRQSEIGRATLKRPGSLGAYDHFLRAQAAIYRFDFAAADAQLAQALERAPDHAMAKALRGWIRTLLWNPDTRPNDQRFDFAIAMAREALALPDTDIEAQAYAGYILAFLGQDIEFGLSLIEHAVASCPNCASAWGSSCILYGLKGDVPRALAHGEEALRLNPADPLGYRVYMGMSLAHIGDRNWTALR
jgi:adenylate cyclase